MLPSHLDGCSHIVCQDDELRAGVLAYKENVKKDLTTVVILLTIRPISVGFS